VLRDHEIRVFMAAGNHDAESQLTRTLTLPPNVTVLSTRAPESVVDDDLGLVVHGIRDSLPVLSRRIWCWRTPGVFLAW
jgi:DNA repair exonuclease SbcCD nuclease subunit